jgi:hypothetical protein
MSDPRGIEYSFSYISRKIRGEGGETALKNKGIEREFYDFIENGPVGACMRPVEWV